MDDDLSPKAAAFVEALRQLCREHGVMLSVSGYDALQVWDWTPDDTDPIYDATGIFDMTVKPDCSPPA